MFRDQFVHVARVGQIVIVDLNIDIPPAHDFRPRGFQVAQGAGDENDVDAFRGKGFGAGETNAL